MKLFPEHIMLNGTQVLVENLLQEKNLKNERKAEFTGFLKEWYSENKYIEVKTSGSTGTPKIIRLQKELVAESARRTLQFFQL
ncbi:MAG: AMP-binding protein, partial [Bacteroidota bacterium]